MSGIFAQSSSGAALDSELGTERPIRSRALPKAIPPDNEVRIGLGDAMAGRSPCAVAGRDGGLEFRPPMTVDGRDGVPGGGRCPLQLAGETVCLVGDVSKSELGEAKAGLA
jgi:hypothetical protein